MGESIKAFEDRDDIYNVKNNHFSTFLYKIAMDLGVEMHQIVDFELNAYDTQKPAVIVLH